MHYTLYIYMLLILLGPFAKSYSSTLPNQIPPVNVNVRLAPELSQDLRWVIKESGNAIIDSIDDFFSTLGNSMPKMGPGIEGIGRSIGASMRPARNEIFKGFLGVSFIITCAIVTKHAVIKYINKYLYQPRLIEEKSSRGLFKKIKSFFVQSAGINEIHKHMIINEQLKQELNAIMATTKNIKNNGGQFEHVLLYGAPGTGKTLFAQLLAKYTDMDYAIVPGANISQFLSNGTAVQELNELFEWASKSNKGTIIFFDEAEIFLAKRSILGLEAQNALNAFLAKTGTPSDKIMIICATNRPELIDEAILNRVGMHIKFPLPTQSEREAQLAMHIQKTFATQKGNHVNYIILKDPHILSHIAEKLEGFSGRKIQQFVNKLRQRALAQNISSISLHLIEQITKETYDQIQAAA